MWECKRIRAELAASLYETPAPAAEAWLAKHMERCPACRAEAQALRTLVDALPKRTAAFEGDLLPVLRAELRGPASRGHWRQALVLTAACLLAGAGLFHFVVSPPAVEAPKVAIDAPVEANPLIALAGEARSRAAAGDYAGARTLLSEGLAHPAAGADPGVLQLALADVEFEQGQRYAEAYDAYKQLQRDYPKTWSASPAETKNRFDLLAEAREDGFEPLYACDAADSFGQLESVVARYPERPLVTALAVERMAERLEQVSGSHVAALEAVRAKCTEPLAIAQLSMALGDVYWKELNNPARARGFYAEAAEAPHLALAQRAQHALAALGAGQR